MAQLQRPSELKTKREQDLYLKTLNLIYQELTNASKIKGFMYDTRKQHKNMITKIIIKGKVNPLVLQWLNDPGKADIKTIDDIPKDIIKKLRYGKILTKKERQILSAMRKVSNKRSEKVLIKDLAENEAVLPINKYKLWKKSKSKYDLNNVDTVPKAVAGLAASRIMQKYGTTDLKKKYSRLGDTTRGVFSYRKLEDSLKSRRVRLNKLLKGTKGSQITLAHEVGHSFDGLFKKFKKPNSKIINEMIVMAHSINPAPFSLEKYKNLNATEKKAIPASLKRYFSYRLKSKELFADSFSLLLYNTSLVKKKYPNFYNYVITKDLKKIINSSKRKIVKNIVKTVKKDKAYLKKEALKKKRLMINAEIKKLQSRKRIGPVTKAKIAALRKKLRG